MACNVLSAVYLAVSMFLLLPQQVVITVIANSPTSEMISTNDAQNINRGITTRHRTLPMLFSPRSSGNSQVIRARLTPIEPLISDILIDDSDEAFDINKRQFDDYGHMRFGKRGEIEEKFDDYGHMRFGRSHVKK